MFFSHNKGAIFQLQMKHWAFGGSRLSCNSESRWCCAVWSRDLGEALVARERSGVVTCDVSEWDISLTTAAAAFGIMSPAHFAASPCSDVLF